MTAKDPFSARSALISAAVSKEWSETMRDHGIQLPPPPSGFYVLGQMPYLTRLPIRDRPTRLQRWCMRVFLGFRWVDA